MKGKKLLFAKKKDSIYRRAAPGTDPHKSCSKRVEKGKMKIEQPHTTQKKKKKLDRDPGGTVGVVTQNT